MEELSIAEKAMRYDVAVKKAKSKITGDKDHILYEDDMIEMFPELKESDDEQIKNEIIDYLKGFIPHHNDDLVAKSKLWITWLEKQGEQKTVSKTEPIIEGLTTEFQKQVSYLIASAINKEHEYTKGYVEWVTQSLLGYAKNEQTSTDKIESKFKVGDWITIDNPCQIISIDGNYIVQYCDDEETREISKKFCEFQFHLWTIQDAKDGDVISFNDGHGNDCIELIKSITDTKNDKKIEFWFCLTNGNSYEVFDGITPYTNFTSREDATPATREQRDTLMKAMADAGYRWNKEELKLEKKDAYNDALDKIEYHSGEPTFDDGWSAAIWYLKKKNAQPQNTWKPSDEQIEVLYKYAEQNNHDGSVLTSLYRDLKKLM